MGQEEGPPEKMTTATASALRTWNASGWCGRSEILAASSAAAEAKGAGGKGTGVFARRAVAAGDVVLAEEAVATARCFPLPKVDAYCAHCGDGIVPAPPGARPDAAAVDGRLTDRPPAPSTCPDCGRTFCSPRCEAAAACTWHHQDKYGCCSRDLADIVHKVSGELQNAHAFALLFPAGLATATESPRPEEPASGETGGDGGGRGDAEEDDGEDEEEEAMTVEQIRIVQEVFTDCTLALRLLCTVQSLPDPDRALKLWTRSLSDAQREKSESIVDNFLLNVGECVQGIDKEAFLLAYDVCVTNSWPGTESRHLFAAHSLLNHSCESNARCHMTPQATVQVIATTGIDPGCEITIDYTDGNTPASLSADDRDELFQQWGHPCLCPRCEG
ncbi:hypothetical protein DIPPA_24790 [Diplonema papillatum]|nr:hypothetical protein DIPPA_24790 [Diplonema papillatum]|eukprot:gene22117-33930_t